MATDKTQCGTACSKQTVWLPKDGEDVQPASLFSRHGDHEDEEQSHLIEILKAQNQELQNELILAHETISGQQKEIQALRQVLAVLARDELGVESATNLLGSKKHAGTTLQELLSEEQGPATPHSPTCVMEEQSTTSLIYSMESSSKPPSVGSRRLEPIRGGGKLPVSEASPCPSWRPPSRIQLGRPVGSTYSRRRISSLSLSDDTMLSPPLVQASSPSKKTTSSSHQTKSRLPSKGQDGACLPMTKDAMQDRLLEALKDPLPPSPSRPRTTHTSRGLRETALKSSAEISTGKSRPSALEEQVLVSKSQDISDLAPETDRLQPPTRVDTARDIVMISSNLSEKSAKGVKDSISQRRKNFLAKASPILMEDKQSRQHILDPPRRIDTPPPQHAHLGGHQEELRSLQRVERGLMADSWDREGIYSGSIDSHTGLPHGEGTMVYALSEPSISTPTTHEYSGSWSQGKYHGHGTLQEAGNVYKGPFEKGLKHGAEEATMMFANGRCFIGRFQADDMREGVLQYEDGSYYEGLLEKNMRNGFGYYRYSSGDQYEGQWLDDMM